MAEIALSAGTLEFGDVGSGPPLVLVHGLVMDGSLWDGVVPALSADHRVLTPTLPLGAHRVPMGPGFDPSPAGLAALLGEFLDALGLERATLVGNDTGGLLVQLLAAAGHPRVGAIALVSCDAFDNVPPGLTGKTLVALGNLPAPLFGAFMQQLRLTPARRMPFSFGWLTKRGDAAVKRWVRALLADRGVRRDAVAVLRALSRHRSVLVEAEAGLRRFDRPARVVWAGDDRVMPPEHGRRLADLLPHGHLVEIADSYTLVPLDQPAALAATLRAFTGVTSGVA